MSDMNDISNLTKDQKTALVSLFAAVMDEIENEDEKEFHETILQDMKDNEGDLENYALFGYLISIILRNIAESVMKDKENEKNAEYKIIG